jgi:hypothetical protein
VFIIFCRIKHENISSWAKKEEKEHSFFILAQANKGRRSKGPQT